MMKMLEKIPRWSLYLCAISVFIGFIWGIKMGSEKTAEMIHKMNRVFEAQDSIRMLRYLHNGDIDTAMLHLDYGLYSTARELMNSNPKDTATLDFIETINTARLKYGGNLDTGIRYPLKIEIKK